MNSRITALFILLFVAVCLVSVGIGQVMPQGAGLTIFFSGDTEGEITKCGCPKLDWGGMTRKAAFVDTLRDGGWEVLLVDAGGLAPFAPLDLQTRIKVRALAKSMAVMEYDGVILGHHDLSLGRDFALEIREWLGQPLLATNYELGEGASERSRVVTVRGTRVGLLGFLDPGLVTGSHDWLGTVAPWKDQVDAVADLAARSDVIVALASVADAGRMADLTALHPAINFVIGTHQGDLRPDLVQTGPRSWTIGMSGKGRFLGHIQAGVDEQNRITGADSKFRPVIEDWGRRAAVDDIVGAYYGELRGLINSEAFLAERLESLKEPRVEYVGTAACVDCHGEEHTQWASTAHARAQQTLVDAEKDQVPECQSCHTTGYGFRTGFVTPATTPERWNVGCESCHGPGAAHLDDTAEPYGDITQEMCLSCHTDHDSPGYDPDTYMPKVVH